MSESYPRIARISFQMATPNKHLLHSLEEAAGEYIGHACTESVVTEMAKIIEPIFKANKVAVNIAVVPSGNKVHIRFVDLTNQ